MFFPLEIQNSILHWLLKGVMLSKKANDLTEPHKLSALHQVTRSQEAGVTLFSNYTEETIRLKCLAELKSELSLLAVWVWSVIYICDDN